MWKADWGTARRHHIDWWRQQGLVFWCTAPADRPHEEWPDPGSFNSLDERWYGPEWRVAKQAHHLSRTYFGGDSFPLMATWSGAGDLAAYLGCEVQLSRDTIWYEPVDPVPDTLTIQRDHPVLRKTLALMDHAMKQGQGRWFVSQPDIIENIDILASLRGTQDLLVDMIDRPEWVLDKLRQINAAFFEVFELLAQPIRDDEGGNTFVFNVWGPGRTAKVQCDASAMFGPDMFQRFVAPLLDEQCRWLDYAMYHLDGEDALVHLDALLSIQSLQAIEWTPRFGYTGEGGGHPKWYDLYRRILAAGKSVQAITVEYEQVIPLLDAVGGKGLFITTSAPTEAAARELEQRVEAYR